MYHPVFESRSSLAEVIPIQNPIPQIERIGEVTNPVLRREMSATIHNLIQLRPYLAALVKPTASLEEQFYSVMKGVDWLTRVSSLLKRTDGILEKILGWLPMCCAPVPDLPAEESLRSVVWHASWRLFTETSDLSSVLAFIDQFGKDDRLAILQGLIGKVPFKDLPQVLEHVSGNDLRAFMSDVTRHYIKKNDLDLFLPLFQALPPSPVRDAALGEAIEGLSTPDVFELVELISDSAKKREWEKKIKDKYPLVKII